MIDQAAPRTRTDWLVIAVLFTAGLVAAMQFGKVAPVMGDVQSAFGLGLVGAGFAVSVLGLIGLLFGVAAGAVVASIGLKRALFIALFGGAAMSALGAIAPNGTVFLASRLAEGFSHLLVVVAAPALMTAHSTRKDMPFVLAIWGCFFGFGFGIISLIAPEIVALGGWRALMGAHAVAVAVTGVALILALTRSGYREATYPFPNSAVMMAAHGTLYRSGAPLILACLFAAYTMPFLAVLTFLGRYLVEVQSWSAGATGSFIAGMTLVNLAATLSVGALVRWGIKLKPAMTASFIMLGLSTAAIFLFGLGNAAIIAATIIAMIAFGLMPGYVFVTVPDVAPDATRAAMTYGGIAQFGNLGTFSGTPLFAFAYGQAGWPGGMIFIALICLSGIAATWALVKAMQRQAASTNLPPIAVA
jgi:MFS transporter, DHA1 family, inner membrane transport protein